MKARFGRLTWILFCVLALQFLSGCDRGKTSSPSSNETEPIVLGATLPLTGDAAAWGKNTQQGIELALEQINASGGVLGRKLEVIYVDTQAMAKEGVSAYRKLVTAHKVPAIIDDGVSSVTLAMAPIAEKDKVVILATGATAPSISEAGDFIFRIWNSDAYESEVAAGYAYHDLGHRTAAILYINNNYGKDLEQVFKSEFSKLGGKIVASESFAQSATNMRAQLTQIKAVKPTLLYLVGYPKETAIALKQSRELQPSVQVLGTVAIKDPQLIEEAGEAAEGLAFPYPKDPSGQRVVKFQTAFRAKYGHEPGITADVGYDAIRMIGRAIEETNAFSGDDIRRGLNMLENYAGVSGTMTFDKNGDVHKPMGIMRVRNRSFEWSG